MEITPITAEEFDAISVTTKKATPFTKAIRELEARTGLQTPCVFPHSPSCNGRNTAHIVAKRAGFKVRARCKDGTVYIFRPEE